jgi:hypothetical protein
MMKRREFITRLGFPSPGFPYYAAPFRFAGGVF